MSDDMSRIPSTSEQQRLFDQKAVGSGRTVKARGPKGKARAVVYAEGHLGELDGKTANGLVRQSDKYELVCVIDSRKAGFDAGVVLEGKPNGIPVRASLRQAIEESPAMPETFIFGIAPSTGLLSSDQRDLILEAITLGMNIVSGLHEFLSDDSQMRAAAARAGVTITDIRKPPDKRDLHTFSGRVNELTCPRIAVMGTDCAIGKRTTATILTKALNAAGIHAILIGTGQTSLIQGSSYGVALDAIPSQFCAGELEAAVLAAVETENPDVIIIEGQGALSHPAFSTSAFILRGSVPDAVIVQHAPARRTRCDFPQMKMPPLGSEINLIELFARTKVIGVTINHENLSEHETRMAIAKTRTALQLPVCDPLLCSPIELVEMVESAFPQLRRTEVEAVT